MSTRIWVILDILLGLVACYCIYLMNQAGRSFDIPTFAIASVVTVFGLIVSLFGSIIKSEWKGFIVVAVLFASALVLALCYTYVPGTNKELYNFSLSFFAWGIIAFVAIPIITVLKNRGKGETEHEI